MPILVIVESGAKGPKIEKMLGKGYQVRGCYGHIQDIPHNLKWIDQHIKDNWDPDKIPYIESTSAKKTISTLRGLAKSASKVIIASDMDREGEAIGYHIRDVLGLNRSTNKKPVERIVFDQITPEAIHHAIDNPTELREPLYRAQQARRVIDIIFGYTVSPLLWHIRPKLSAGRCQSPALRWLYQRQQEFMALTTLEAKHNITAELNDDERKGADPLLTKYVDKQTTGHTVLDELETIRKWHISSIVHSKSKQSPPQPLTTSAMQQKCYNKFGWSAKKTNVVAQKLYEAGHITYIRTDCKVLSDSFVESARAHLLATLGDAYVSDIATTQKKKRTSKKQALAQEAHEPIRPVYCEKRTLTDAECHTMKMEAKPLRMLYTFVYETTLSSLMTCCLLNKYQLNFHPHPPSVQHHTLHKVLSCVEFPGFRVWEFQLPFAPQTCPYKSHDIFSCHKYVSEIKHPLPIRPYSSGELLKGLESNGIGRPSTYSSIIERLEDRKYIEHQKGSGVSPWQRALANHPMTQNTNEEVVIDMRPKAPTRHVTSTATDIVSQLGDRYYVTVVGREAIHYLLAQEKLKELTETHFTQELEQKLDDITHGNTTYSAVVKAFYDDLMASTKGLHKPIASGVDGFRDHPSKRLLQDNTDHYYVALENDYGPAVALLYKDAKRKKEGVFVNIPDGETMASVSLGMAKKLIQEKKQQMNTDGGNTGRLLGTKDDKTIYARMGRYGAYLVWNDVSEPHLPEQSTAFVNKSVGVMDVTLEQAVEWIGQATLTLRKVNTMYTVKYNPKYDSVYISRPNTKSRGRPLSVPLPDVRKEDMQKINALLVKDCQVLFEEKHSSSVQKIVPSKKTLPTKTPSKKTPPKRPKKSKQTQKK